jgi:hypothetical protein
MTNPRGQTSVTHLLEAIKPIKSRLGVITAVMVGEEDLRQEMLDAAYDHHEHLRAVQIVLSRLAETEGARINEAAIDALRELVEETRAYLAQPDVAFACPVRAEAE